MYGNPINFAYMVDFNFLPFCLYIFDLFVVHFSYLLLSTTLGIHLLFCALNFSEMGEQIAG